MGKITEMILGIGLGLGLAEFFEDEEVVALVDELVADNDAIVNRLEDELNVCEEEEVFRSRTGL